ncbi:MAG: hypothetical protein K0Q49_938 [Haloplasmataceae bacterium]|jgi:hypothetical protein|nr:hypothetical protein [Haloplasmataceae bacterium]
MEKISFIILLFILSIFIILYIFMEKETSYHEFNTINTYTIYVRDEDEFYQELIFVDSINEYIIQDNQYILKNNYRTMSLKDALLNEVISIKEAMEIIPDISVKPKNHYEIGSISSYTIYQSEDMNNICKQTMDYFYIDDRYEYFFNCKMSKFYLIRGNNQDYTLTEALEEKLFHIEDIKGIIPTIKYKTISYQTIDIIDNIEIVETTFKYDTKDQIEIIFLIDDKLYYFPSQQSKFYKIKYGNNYLRLQEALDNHLISIDELRLIIPDIYER